MEFRDARKQLLVYKKAQEGKVPKKLGKAVNIFFRHPFMARCVSTYLGPHELEYELKQLKDNFGLFYLRHEESQRELDITFPTYLIRWQRLLSRCYSFQRTRIEWCQQNLDICIQNLAGIDSRKEVYYVSDYDPLPNNIEIDRRFYIGYHRSLDEMDLFVSDTNTNVIEKASIIRFIKLLSEELKKDYDDWEIYDTIKRLECKLLLLFRFLETNFDLKIHMTRRYY